MSVLLFIVTCLQHSSADGVPIVIGPVSVHGNSDFKTHTSLLGHLSMRLVAGSDDELALCKTNAHCFPAHSLHECF